MSDIPFFGEKLPPVILSGFSSRPLANNIAGFLDTRVQDVGSKQFDDKEIYNEILSNVRGREVFIIASAAGDPNKQIVETVLLSSAAKDAEAKQVTVVVPYQWYGRGDGTWGKRTAPSLNAIVSMLRPHADRFVVVDPHNTVATASAYRGDTHKPYLMVHMAYPWAVQLKDMIDRGMISKDRLLLMHADAGGTKRIGPDFRECMYHTLGLEGRNPNQDDWPQGIKHRDSVTQKMKVDGLSDDVSGKDIVVFEDMIASGGTACDLAALCKNKGARSVTLFTTNALLTRGKGEAITAAVDRLTNSQLDFVGVMDTYDHSSTNPRIHKAIENSPVVHMMPSAKHLASIAYALSLDVVRGMNEDENSVSKLLRGQHMAQEPGGVWASRPIDIKPGNPLLLRAGASPTS